MNKLLVASMIMNCFFGSLLVTDYVVENDKEIVERLIVRERAIHDFFVQCLEINDTETCDNLFDLEFTQMYLDVVSDER